MERVRKFDERGRARAPSRCGLAEKDLVVTENEEGGSETWKEKRDVLLPGFRACERKEEGSLYGRVASMHNDPQADTNAFSLRSGRVGQEGAQG